MKTIIERGASWSLEETRLLLSLWGEDLVSRQVSNTKRTKECYEKIAGTLVQHGFERTAEQVRTRVFNMIAEYRRILKDPYALERQKKCVFFEPLHKIYQAKHMDDVKSALDDYEPEGSFSPNSASVKEEPGESEMSVDHHQQQNNKQQDQHDSRTNNSSDQQANSNHNLNNTNTTSKNTTITNNNTNSSSTTGTGTNDHNNKTPNESSSSSSLTTTTTTSNHHHHHHPTQAKKLKTDSPKPTSNASSTLLTAQQNNHGGSGIPAPSTPPSSSSSAAAAAAAAQRHSLLLPRLPTSQLYQAPVNTFDVTSSALLIDRMFAHLAKESENMREWIALEKERLQLERVRRQQEADREIRRERVITETLMKLQDQWLSFLSKVDPRVNEAQLSPTKNVESCNNNDTSGNTNTNTNTNTNINDNDNGNNTNLTE